MANFAASANPFGSPEAMFMLSMIVTPGSTVRASSASSDLTTSLGTKPASVTAPSSRLADQTNGSARGGAMSTGPSVTPAGIASVRALRAPV